MPVTDSDVDRALEALDVEHCPVDGSKLTSDMESDEHGVNYFLSCSLHPPHVWPVARATVEYDTNYFEVEFDPDTIRDRLGEYVHE